MLKLACLVVLCAIVAVHCQDTTPWSKPGKEDSNEEGTDSSEEQGGFEKRPPPMHGKNGKGRPFQSANGNNDDDDVNVNVNVHIGGDAAGQQRPQWFGDRPQKGRPDRGDDGSDEQDGYHGGKRPRPPHPETNGSRPDGERPPRPESNSSRPEGERPPRPESNHTRPDGERPGDKDRGHRGPGGKYEREDKNDKGYGGPRNEQDNSDNNDVNVNVNVHVSRGNDQGNHLQQGGYGKHRPQIGGKEDHRGKGEGGPRPPKSEGNEKPWKPDGSGGPPSRPPGDNDKSSSEQTE